MQPQIPPTYPDSPHDAPTDGSPLGTRPKLWNPNVAGILSVLLLAPFGAVIHGLNWRSLGKKDDAKISFLWAAGIFLSGMVIVFSFDDPPTFTINAILLIVWHYAHGKKQIAFTKSLPGGYEKKPIWLPAVLGLVAVVVLAGIFALIAGVSSLLSGSNEQHAEVVRNDHDGKEYETLILGNIEDGKVYKELSVEDLNKNPEKYHSKDIEINLEMGMGDSWIEERTGTASKIISFRASNKGDYGIEDTIISALLIPEDPGHRIFNDIVNKNLRPGESILVSGKLTSGKTMRRISKELKEDLARKGVDYPEAPTEIHNFEIYASRIILYRRVDRN